ncbi:MAG: hypothetical protein FJW40_16250 [Acidobacteria bacterium]|nr:hypothetical protein [Acidobacteriota bacterium]
MVCVIEEMFGADAKKASDDTYKLALLPMGFTWGFSIEKTGKGTTKDDYTVTKLDFAWLAAPSDAFKTSWGQTYGKDPKTDKFNLAMGDCKDCLMIPEPGSSVLAVVGVALLFAGRLRRRG